MSEQTPDTNNGMSDGQDPSMEDILASIRKIIADDDVQGVEVQDVDAPETIEEIIEVQTSEGDVSALVQVETLDLNIIEDAVSAKEADIDSLIGSMDAQMTDDIATPQLEITSADDDSLDDILDLKIPLDDVETGSIIDTLDETIDLTADQTLAMGDEPAELTLDSDGSKSAAEPLEFGGEVPAQDDLSLMLDNMLEDSASYQEDTAAVETVSKESVVDPAEDLLAEIDLTEDASAEASAPKPDADMDLVKSLMADLTEEPLYDESEAETQEAVADIDDDSGASSDDVMGEILSMTLDDETKLSEEIAIPDMNTAEETKTALEGLSLKDIAAAAEADAQSSDSVMGKGMVAAAGVGGVGMAASIAAAATQADTTESVGDDVDTALSKLDDLLADDSANLEDLTTESPETLPEPLIMETPEMPRAAKSDAIIDEVTETATAGAFASLNQVVEEKATVAERGDRIGDLVMEALQPMLKEWLDANLKGIVERAVTKEVKRISSGK